ncbi:MAG: hypothetical protein ACFFEO_15505, partial [Candidatus Thorarchaeota archaeon]
MSIKKWLEDETIGEARKRREEKYRSLSKEEKYDLKKKKIEELVKKESKEEKGGPKSEFLQEITKFNEWLNQRNYIRGDIDKIETWIRNLYNKLISDSSIQAIDDNILKKEYKKIPPTFLDEKTRIAFNKKLKNITRTSSDNYYLRKLNQTIKEKLKEAEYYEILR